MRITSRLEKEFLKLYSKWHETHDEALKNRLYSSMGRLMAIEPSFDFRQMLWQVLS